MPYASGSVSESSFRNIEDIPGWAGDVLTQVKSSRQMLLQMLLDDGDGTQQGLVKFLIALNACMAVTMAALLAMSDLKELTKALIAYLFAISTAPCLLGTFVLVLIGFSRTIIPWGPVVVYISTGTLGSIVVIYVAFVIWTISADEF